MIRYAAAFAAGACLALLASLALIPDQPDRILVPVEAPTGVAVIPPPTVDA